jgi:hypothetical protein
MRRSALLLAVAALALPALAPAAPPRLVWRVAKDGSYRVRLPATWRFRDASYPSDHSTHLWYDPANPLRKLLVVVSGCVGCVEKNFDPHRPNPAAEVPRGATTFRISPWKVAFSTYTSDDPYPENGVVVVLHRSAAIDGSAIAKLWLPQREHATATAVLNSFSPQP